MIKLGRLLNTKNKNTKHKGEHAENLVKAYLLKQGLSFVDQHFYSRYGEIDLIFKDNDTLVFIEVRYRKDQRFGHSIETVHCQKQQKIIKAARYYLQKHNLHESINCRFDVVGIDTGDIMQQDQIDETTIEWIISAFEAPVYL